MNRDRYAITEWFMDADVHLCCTKDKHTFTAGRFARSELIGVLTFVAPGSDEWNHLEPVVNALLAHVASRVDRDDAWRDELGGDTPFVALEIAVLIDQTLATPAKAGYSMELHVRVGRLSIDEPPEEAELARD